ncbi:MAG: YihY/virulence factor BrkB family protein, partial [Leptospiraceae bacterium]|nr:YihY/virulence factor BrkB family protein [Leptospiraceae bacterium]
MDPIRNYKTRISQVLYPVLTWPPVMKSMLFIRGLVLMARAAAEKFVTDSCSIRSSSIAYAIAISVIPILTILIRFAAIDRVTIRANLASFLAANGMADSTELLAILDEILGRANQIAGLGVLFMLYSATNLVRNLEEAFNHIYRAKHDRPILYRFALYIASFAIIPTLLIFSAGAARIALTRLQPAEPTAMIQFQGAQWVLHEPGLLWRYQKNDRGDTLDEIKLFTRANTGAAFRDIFIDETNQHAGPSWEIVGRDYSPPVLQRSDLYNTILLKKSADAIYVVTRKGLILQSRDSGHTWNYWRIHFKLTEVYSPEVHDLWVSPANRLILLVSINSRTGLVQTNDLINWSYQRLDGVYDRVFEIQGVDNPASEFQNGLYLGGKGRYIFSGNEGRNWTIPIDFEFGDRRLYLADLKANAEGDTWFIAQSGEAWRVAAGQRKQTVLNLRIPAHGVRIRGFSVSPQGSLLIYGDEDFFRYSPDGGSTWLKASNPVLNESSFRALAMQPDGSYYLSTAHQSLIHIQKPRLLPGRDQQGYPYIHFDASIRRSLPLWFTIIGKTLVNLFIFIICFLMFFSAYKFIPNTRVDWRAAAGGS